ncbi:MAG: hypothetical protein AAF532_10915 [Planctomycetota bacterium]
MRNEITDEEAARWECVDHAMAEVLRRKSGAERLAMVDTMWRTGWKMIFLGYRRDHPDWSEGRCRRETARRMSHGAF